MPREVERAPSPAAAWRDRAPFWFFIALACAAVVWTTTAALDDHPSSRTVRVTRDDGLTPPVQTVTETQEPAGLPDLLVSRQLVSVAQTLIAVVAAYIICSLVARAWRANWTIQLGSWLNLPEPSPLKADEVRRVVETTLSGLLAEQAVVGSGAPATTANTSVTERSSTPDLPTEQWDDPRTSVVLWRARAEEVLRRVAASHGIDAARPAMDLALDLQNAGVVSPNAAVGLRYLLAQASRVLDGAAVSSDVAKLIEDDGRHILDAIEEVAKSRH